MLRGDEIEKRRVVSDSDALCKLRAAQLRVSERRRKNQVRVYGMQGGVGKGSERPQARPH